MRFSSRAFIGGPVMMLVIARTHRALSPCQTVFSALLELFLHSSFTVSYEVWTVTPPLYREGIRVTEKLTCLGWPRW